jgi:hypothetical protein
MKILEKSTHWFGDESSIEFNVTYCGVFLESKFKEVKLP